MYTSTQTYNRRVQQELTGNHLPPRVSPNYIRIRLLAKQQLKIITQHLNRQQAIRIRSVVCSLETVETKEVLLPKTGMFRLQQPR